MRTSPLALVALCACGAPQAPTPAPAPTRYTTSTIALPGATADGVVMDYLLYDARTAALWVPAGNTGSVDVIATATSAVHRIEGFATAEVERRGAKRTVGPSVAALGPAGTNFIGNRGDSSICAVDETTLARGACGQLDAMPDGVIFAPSRNEVWVTTPRDRSVRVLDAATLAQTALIKLDGAPEGFAVDATRGRFYTNLEDKDLTLAIDLASHATVATWHPACGEDGPHGIRLLEREGLLLVACDAKLEVLDVGHDGRIVSTLATGAGVDDLDYDPSTRRIFAGGAEAATLTIASLSPTGTLTAAATVPTAPGARNAVLGPAGRIYLAHSHPGEIVVVSPSP